MTPALACTAAAAVYWLILQQGYWRKAGIRVALVASSRGARVSSSIFESAALPARYIDEASQVFFPDVPSHLRADFCLIHAVLAALTGTETWDRTRLALLRIAAETEIVPRTKPPLAPGSDGA